MSTVIRSYEGRLANAKTLARSDLHVEKHLEVGT